MVAVCDCRTIDAYVMRGPSAVRQTSAVRIDRALRELGLDQIFNPAPDSHPERAA